MLKLVDKLGGWPVLEGDKWEKKKFVWHEFDGKILNSLATLKIHVHFKFRPTSWQLEQVVL